MRDHQTVVVPVQFLLLGKVRADNVSNFNRDVPAIPIAVLQFHLQDGGSVADGVREVRSPLACRRCSLG